MAWLNGYVWRLTNFKKYQAIKNTNKIQKNNYLIEYK